MLQEDVRTLEEGEEDLESQLDRLNEVLTKTIQSAQQTVNTDPEQDESLYVLESPVESQDRSSQGEVSFDVELQGYVETLMIELERRQMRLEEVDSQVVEWGQRGVVFAIQKAEITEEDLKAMISAIEKLQRIGNSKVPIGSFQVDIVLRPNTADTGSSGSLENTQKLWERLQPKGTLEAREQALLLKEEALQCEYSLLKQQQAAFACEQQRLVQSTQLQAMEAINLKERIEELLQEQRSSLLDISSSSQSFSLPAEAPTVYEADLKALKAQIPDANLEEIEGISVKREMERAEEMIRSSEDASKIRLQLTIARNHIIQFKGHLLAKEAEKMAKSVNISMQALGTDLLLQRSKNRIKEQLLQKMRSAATSPRATIGTKSPFKHWEPSSYSYANSPVRTSIEEVQTRQRLEGEDKQERLKLQVNRLEERNKQLNERVTMLQEQLRKYKSYDVDLADKRGKVKAGIRRVIAIQNVLSKQETALSDRETRLSMHEDSLRTALARTFTGAEAREFLTLRAKALTEQQQNLMRDWAFVDLAKTDLAAEKERVRKDSRRLEREKERVGKKWERLDKERRQLDAVRSRLEALLPVLASTENS